LPIPSLHIPIGSKTPSAFRRGRTERELRLVIDDDLYSGDWTADYRFKPIDAFRHHRGVEVSRLADSRGEGHIVRGELDEQHDRLPITIFHGGHRVDTAIAQHRQWQRIAGSISNQVGLPAQTLYDDLLVPRIAREVGADALVTDRQQLFNSRLEAVREANPLHVPDALALLGLFLRSREDFTWRWIDATAPLTYNKSHMYDVAVRAFLDSNWRYTSACTLHYLSTRNDTSMMLAYSVLERFNRVLRMRDQVHQALLGPQNTDTADDVMVSLDALMLFLVGAFDAIAQVVNLICALPFKAFGVSWRNPKWLKALSTRCPKLYEAVAV
jgi:hypothetical protein